MLVKNLILPLTALALFLVTGCRQSDSHGGEHEIHEKQEGRSAHAEHESNEDEGEDHGEHAAREAHETHDLEVKLSKKAMALAGITTQKVQLGRITETVELTGEVGLDEDKVSHIVPRFGGIARKVHKKLGDYVKAGETLAEVESNETLSSYRVKSLIAGQIIEKHITLGEFVSNESNVFVVADLSRVWVNFAVYDKDIRKIRIGQQVQIESIGGNADTHGRISFIGNVYDSRTRRLTARAVIPNTGMNWRPGTFVRGLIQRESGKPVPVVEKGAVQIVEDKTCLFMPETEGVFRVVPVTIKEGGSQWTEILAGVSEGDAYVSSGAFELKAKLVTSSLGGHAGHGH